VRGVDDLGGAVDALYLTHHNPAPGADGNLVGRFSGRTAP
jgi:hypothetical protein